MGHATHFEHRVVVLKRVVPVVIAKWPLRLSHTWRYVSDQRELSVGDERMVPMSMHLGEPLAGDERSQHQLRDVLRERGHCGKNQRRWTSQKYRGGKLLTAPLGNGVVKATTLSNLPVHAGRARVIHLQAVHPEVACPAGAMRRRMPRPIGMRCTDEGKSNE